MNDASVPVGYIQISTRTAARTIECGDGTMVDVDRDGKIVGVETVGHTDFHRAAFAALRSLTVASGDPAVQS